MDIDIAGETILVTGGAGFIGTALIESLVRDNQVIAFDDFSRGVVDQPLLASRPNLTVVEGDILDLAQVRQAMRGAGYVLHCAGITGIDTVKLRPTHTMRVNAIGSANVLTAAQEQTSLRRLIYFSTSEVFGRYAMGADETDHSVIGAVGEARWIYAVSKLAGEHLAIAHHTEFGLPTTVVRPFNVYGPGQIGEGALRTFIRRALRDEPLEIHGDGVQIRAWCYIDDMVDGVRLAMVHPQAVGESFNIGNRRSVETIYGLANTVVRVLESKSEIRFVRRDYADVELRIPSVAKAREILGYEAQVGLEEGIARTAEFYRRELCV